MQDPPFTPVSCFDAGAFIERENPFILDVRTPEEYHQLGHVKDAALSPLGTLTSAVPGLPQDGTPILVYCEHGVRSLHAIQLLSQAGIKNLYNLTEGYSQWALERDHTEETASWKYQPSDWLVEHAGILSKEDEILDLASGSGRNALLLAHAGFKVTALDRDENALAKLKEFAQKLNVSDRLDLCHLDLETTPPPSLPSHRFDVILGFHYLHRPLFPSLIESLKPGGHLLYETFTRAQAKRGKPTNPDFLLEPDELKTLVHPLEILSYREGLFAHREVAGILAKKA